MTAKGQVGSEAELILGVNRTLMTASTGSLYAGILQFTDSLNLTRLDVPVTAKVASKSGLWIGQAAVNQVRHYLKNYVKQPSGEMEIGSDGKYIVSSVNTNLGSVGRALASFTLSVLF